MVYTSRYDNGVLIVEIDDAKGALSDLDVNGFISDIQDLNSASKNLVVFDVGLKKHFNSSELGILIKARDMLFEEGIELMLMNPSKNIRELLKIVGLNDFFRIYAG